MCRVNKTVLDLNAARLLEIRPNHIREYLDAVQIVFFVDGIVFRMAAAENDVVAFGKPFAFCSLALLMMGEMFRAILSVKK